MQILLWIHPSHWWRTFCLSYWETELSCPSKQCCSLMGLTAFQGCFKEHSAGIFQRWWANLLSVGCWGARGLWPTFPTFRRAIQAIGNKMPLCIISQKEWPYRVPASHSHQGRHHSLPSPSVCFLSSHCHSMLHPPHPPQAGWYLSLISLWSGWILLCQIRHLYKFLF